MPIEEKKAWIMMVTTLVANVVYVVIILSRVGPTPLVEVPYVATMLWIIGAAILANLVLTVIVSAQNPREADQKDERDREINRFGEAIGQSFGAIGGVGALVLAMIEAPYFWIANGLYLAFALSAMAGSAAKIMAYREGLPRW